MSRAPVACRRRFDGLLLSLALCVLLPAIGLGEQRFHYREQTGGVISTFTWQAAEEAGGERVTVIQHQGTEVYSSVNDPNGVTRSWHYIKEPDTDVWARREGDSLLFSGRFGGKPMERRQQLDGRPWCQPLSYSLQRMVVRRQARTSFWTIRPDTLEVLSLQAKMAGSEQLKTAAEGGATLAEKVTIRLEGLLAAMWHADYWFRQGDGLFLQYRSTHGPPGTPETRIALINP